MRAEQKTDNRTASALESGPEPVEHDAPPRKFAAKRDVDEAADRIGSQALKLGLIDGVNQSPHLFDGQEQSNRDHLLTFTGVRWRRCAGISGGTYTANYHLSSTNPSLGGFMGHSNPTAGYPMAFNIEADPREQRNVMAEQGWVIDPFMEHVGPYHASLQQHPNPP